ncbi:MAG: hypothetical protein J5698_01635 [Bacteroidaceae bacterium]|nr:hypothetical protein [Bacteroidaceae bacterium]
MEQTERKDYAAAFAIDSRRIVVVGINFSRDERTITEWTITKHVGLRSDG